MVGIVGGFILRSQMQSAMRTDCNARQRVGTKMTSRCAPLVTSEKMEILNRSTRFDAMRHVTHNHVTDSRATDSYQGYNCALMLRRGIFQ